MMKKLLILFLSAMMVFSLAACGGDDTTSSGGQQIENNADNDAEANNDADANNETNEGYTDEQQACIQEYEQMLADYNAAVNVANATPELVNDTEFVDMMNEVSASIDTITDKMGDPANMTEDFMLQIDSVIDAAYIIVNRIEAYSEILPILTLAGVGVDEEENTYWFACSEDETVGAMVILSVDQTENAYCIGEMVIDENGVYTINDEEGYTMSMSVEAVEGGLILTLQDGTQVGMVAAEPREVVEAILSIQESTQNVNGQ